MINESVRASSQDNFDFDGHIEVFLHTSAVYFDVKNSPAICRAMPSGALPAAPASHM
jgi:hypothetical protein